VKNDEFTRHRSGSRVTGEKRGADIHTTANEPCYLLGAGFRQWSQPWSRLGLWVSLWDERAECVEGSSPSVRFWETLAGHSRHVERRLSEIARQVVCAGPARAQLDQEPGILVAGVPVTCRQRTVGSLLICALTPELLEPNRALRFCQHHDLDRTTLVPLVAEVPPHSSQELGAFADILSHQAESLAGQALARRDVEDLSSQLANAYEQFHLLYRLSTDMTLSSKPLSLLTSTCQDLLAATVVESFAAILTQDTERPAGPACVVAGPLDIPRCDLVRLYEQACGMPRNAGGCTVVNDVADRSELSWAASWLSQFILFPLCSSERTFGGLLAINRRDGQDFGSEEVRFAGAVAQRASTFLENARLYEDLEKLFMGMLHALVSSIDAKDPYTCGHSQRVAWLSRHIAGLAGLGEAECQRAYLSGLLHDIGKIGISEAVLRNQGLLTLGQQEEIRRHPEIGASILKGVRQIDDIIPGVLHHHDRFDGTGYPFDLKGDEIPLLGRIVCLADSFDAITTSRTYQTARSMEAARAELLRCAGSQFDPHLTKRFLEDDLDELGRKLTASGCEVGELVA
jgi:HD-GYP domain-containing protein (c-di-GMP phosphodiesterase class II)